MSKPVKKSPPIQFRVPIEHWPTLQQQARRARKSVNEYVRDVLVESVEEH